jgi:hypothetical protein
LETAPRSGPIIGAVKRWQVWIIVLGAFAVLAAVFWLQPQNRKHFAGLSAPTVTADGFLVGERWSYHTRPGEEGSTFVVGRIEQSPSGQRIVHVRVEGIQLKIPPEPKTYIPHVPIDEGMLLKSRLERRETGIDAVGGEFTVWYADWRDGERRAFDMELAEVIGQIEKQLENIGPAIPRAHRRS